MRAIVLCLLAGFLHVASAAAVTRTASVSGDINNSATFGGATFVDGDAITINAGICVRVPSGVTVTIGTGTATAGSTSGTDGSGNPNAVIVGSTTSKFLIDGGTVNLRGNAVFSNVSNQAYSAYASDGQSGSLGDAFEIKNAGTLNFVNDDAKQWLVQVWGVNDCFRRLKTSGNSVIKSTGSGSATGNGRFSLFALDLADTVLQNCGTSSVACITMNMASASDTAGEEASRWFKFTRVTFDQCGVLASTSGIYQYCTFDMTDCEFLRELGTFAWQFTNISTAPAGSGYRRLTRVNCTAGSNITSTTSGADNGMEIQSCVLGAVSWSFTNSRCKSFDGNFWQVADGNGQSISSIPCNTITGGYCTTKRPGTHSGNEKMLNAANGAYSACPTFTSLIMEVANDSSTGTLADAGEFYQHDKERRDGTAFTDCIFVSSEDGTTYRTFEVAALSNTVGFNEDQPPTNPFGQVIYTRCKVNAQDSTLGFGHTPTNDCPGLDRVRFTDGIMVGASANALGGSSQTWSNLTGPATAAGIINAAIAADADYADAITVDHFTGNLLVRLSTGAYHSPSGTNAIFAQGAAWGLSQSAQNGAATVTLLQSTNTYTSDWGRTADLTNYLNSRPGGGAEGPGRRIRTLGVASGVVGSGSGSTLRDSEWTLSWKAMAANRLAPGHFFFTSGHPLYVAGVTPTAATAWVQADWVLPFRPKVRAY